jgi:hypothetical protein
MKKLFALQLALFSLILSSCDKEDDMPPKLEEDTKWWLLVHPSHGNEGVYLYNETDSIVELKFELPEKLTSPHALDFDGESLWIGGAESSASIFEISPIDGTILSEIGNIRTEGIACLNNDLYYAGSRDIFRISKQGVPIDTISTQASVIQDIAINNSNLYYASNMETDPIFKINQANSIEEKILETEVTALYTLTIQDNNIVVVADNKIRRFDINSGEKISDANIYINFYGWITAIAPYNQ